MSSELAISARNVSKVYRIYERPEHRLIQMATLGHVRRFKEFAALHDVSLDVRRGETVGIVGRNGCGKSTLLQIICGTLQPSQGSVDVRGRIAALLELGAGFSGEFTGRENVYMNGAILGVSRDEMDARFEQIAQFAGIGDFIERPVKTYSSGMYVRLAFAVATAVEPDILIVDEALSVGDEAFQRKCFARIEAIKERGGTILFVSHGAQMIVQLCDRAVLLDAGEKLLESEPKVVINQYQRLMYADPNRSATIREEIRSGDLLEKHSADDKAAQPRRGKKVPEFFDETLKPESTIDYPERGGRISEFRITSANGEQVNVLNRNQRYRLSYRVEFFEQFKTVGFASFVKTVQGLELSGQTTHKLGEGIDVAPGSVFDVSFEFITRLLPGVYFCNAGTYTSSGDGFLQIHRIVDGVAFRVRPDEAQNVKMGLVDLSASDTSAATVQQQNGDTARINRTSKVNANYYE